MHDDVGQEAPKAKKVSRRRNGYTRSGCITCKIRHLKCDEQRPSCNRCVSTGRKCDGYPEQISTQESASRRKLSSSPPDFEGALTLRPSLPIGDITGSDRERRSWHHFYSRTAPILAGYFDFDFWNRHLLQMGRSEPILTHAVIAVSVVHECAARLGNLPVNTSDMQIESDHRFALEQYNKAIGHLRRRSSSSQSSVEITLMVCILFVCLEFLQHNNENALDHVRNGLRILTSLENKDADGVGVTSSVQLLPHPQGVDHQLMHIFLRLATQCKFLGLEFGFPSSLRAESKPGFGPLMFSNIIQARESMDSLQDEVLRFVIEAESLRDSPIPSGPHLATQLDLLKELDWWLFAFETYLGDHEATMNAQEIEATKMLHVNHRITKIWLSMSLSPSETAFDAHLSDFRAVITIAESMLETSTSYRTFSFEMGAYPPIYFVALKCRHPLLRRRAIKLLSNHHRQESHWHTLQMASAASRVVAIEEAEVPKNLTLDQFGPGSISEEIRVRDLSVKNASPCNVPSSNITFKTKPHGPYGEWFEWTENVAWAGSKEGTKV